METERAISRETLKHIFPNLLTLYCYATGRKGYYLPEFKDSKRKDNCITFDYLIGVIAGENFAPKREGMKISPSPKRSIEKAELVDKIEALAKKKLNFHAGGLPEKQWLLDVLFNLNPEDEIFQSVQYPQIFKLFPIEVAQELEKLPKFAVKNARGYRLSAKERALVKKEQAEKNIYRAAQKIKFLEREGALLRKKEEQQELMGKKEEQRSTELDIDSKKSV